MEERTSSWQPPLWGIGQVAVQIFRDVPSLLLLFYMTQVLSIPAFMAGSSIFLPKLLWGGLCDVTIGTFLDRVSLKIPRRYFLLLGALLTPVALILLFVPPTAETASERSLHISLLLCLYMLSFSAFSVPHLAIGTEISQDPHQQSKIMAWRTAFIGVGLLCGAALAPFLVQYFGGGVRGYQIMSYFLSALCCGSLVIAFAGSREPSRLIVERRRPTQGNWAAVLANRPFLFLFFAYFAQLVGQGSAYATLAYVVTFKLGFSEPLKVLSLSVLITGTLFVFVQPLLVRFVKRWGTRRSFIVGSVFYALSLIWIAFSPKESIASLVGASIALGISNASTFQSIFTRLSLILSQDRCLDPGERSRSGFYASLFVINDKVAFAFGGTLIAGSILSLFKFVPGGTMDQPESAITGIILAFAGVPLIANILAITLMAIGPDSTRPTKTSKDRR